MEKSTKRIAIVSAVLMAVALLAGSKIVGQYYVKGCVAGINDLAGLIGMGIDQEKATAHCAEKFKNK